MPRAAVIALSAIFHYQLPVGMFGKHCAVSDLGIFQVVGRQHRLDLSAEFVKAWNILRQGNEDHTGDYLAVHRPQAMAVRVEVGRHVPGEDQVAGQVVGPLMVGAHQAACRTLFAGAEQGSPVPAGVEVRPYHAFGLTDDYH
ncbi:hypothetical protein D3C76_1326780 [compost metagenome]